MTLTRGGNTIDLDIIHNGVELIHRPLRNTVQVTADGAVVGSPPQKYETFAEVTVRIPTLAKLGDLRTFVLTTCGIRGDTFTVTPDSNVDLGAGAGVAITARFWEELSEPVKGFSVWYIDLSLRKEVS